jgi:hypothetical protein
MKLLAENQNSRQACPMNNPALSHRLDDGCRSDAADPKARGKFLLA